MTIKPLPKPAVYVPLERGRYEVAPGLFPLGHDFGQDELDKRVFQIDDQFSHYYQNKVECRKERLTKYAPKPSLPKAIETEVAKFLVERMCSEWPESFSFDGSSFISRLSRETFSLNENWELVDSNYRDVIDALISQVPEDLAVVVNTQDDDYLGLLHVCSPSHWAPEDKNGKNFEFVHAPIPGVEKLNKAARSLVGAMVNKGPFVRFVWSFVTDTRLNHHPDPPPGANPKEWRGRAFDKNSAVPFYLRVERQITFGLPQVEAALFFIRVSFVPSNVIRENEVWRKNLLSSLQSMSPESRVYKGVRDCFDDLTEYLSV